MRPAVSQEAREVQALVAEPEEMEAVQEEPGPLP